MKRRTPSSNATAPLTSGAPMRNDAAPDDRHHQLRDLIVYLALIYPSVLAALSYVSRLITGRNVRFRPERDGADLEGRVVLVTGGNAGIGRETVRQMARRKPERIFLAARDEGRARAAIEDVRRGVPGAVVDFVRLDLMDFDSIRLAAEEVRRKVERLDVLVLNAGIMATPYATTSQGFESQLGTNHIGHAYLTKLLLPLMVKTAEQPDADVRIISVSSIGQHMAPRGGIVFDPQVVKTLTPAQRYAQSKLANVLFVKELARRYPSITSVAVHPGMIRTDLYGPVQKAQGIIRIAMQLVGGLFFYGVEDGALNQLWAALAPKTEVRSGQYHIPVGNPSGQCRYAEDEGLAKKLWEWTDEQIAMHE